MTASFTKVLATEQLMHTQYTDPFIQCPNLSLFNKRINPKGKILDKVGLECAILNGLKKSTLNNLKSYPHCLLGWYYLKESAGGYEHFLWFSALNLVPFSRIPGNPQPA